MKVGTAARILGVFACLLDGVPCAAQSPPPPHASRAAYLASLPRAIEAKMKAENVPGAAVAVVDRDGVVWARGFGVRNVAERAPVDAGTIFSIQSISKTFTTLAFLRAVERGEVCLDDRVTARYPSFTMKSRYGAGDVRTITFRQLLGHWAGLPHEAPLGSNYDERYTTLEDHVKSLARSWTKAPAGSRFSYSNAGVDVAGYVLATVAHEPFAALMKRDVLGPLGMSKSTVAFDDLDGAGNFAQGYLGGHVVPTMRVPMQPAGGMYSSARDLARFVMFALRGETSGRRRLVTAAHLAEMERIQFRAPRQTSGYGLGVEVARVDGVAMLGHGGSGYGYSTKLAWLPAYGVGVVVLANAGDVGFSDDLARDVLAALAELKNPRLRGRLARPAAVHAARLHVPLATFEGTYKPYGRVVTVQARNATLVLRRGDAKTPLTRVGETSFLTAGGDALDFRLGPGHRVDSARYTDGSGIDTWFVNERTGEPPGRFPAAWKKFVGSYRLGGYGQEFTTKVFQRNGRLFSTRNGGMRLIPFSAHTFFTPDGESVVFRGERMLLGNRPAFKVVPTPAPARSCDDVPSASWTRWDSPEAAGWNRAKLAAAAAHAQSMGSAAGMVVLDGRVLHDWGETDRKLNVHSIRKSLLSALIGGAVHRGDIALGDTLARLGIDDAPPRLSAAEKRATVRDLLEARSGVFHPALYETADMIAAKPKRGSHAHGTYWLYSNWDFNALGTIYERATNAGIFRDFQHRIAEPLQMQDFRPADGAYVDGDASVHPAYPFRMTARDMARFGLLYLRGGAWCGQQVVPRSWVRESTTAREVTDYKSGVGYGYLWWVAVGGKLFPQTAIGQPAYYAWGTGGHYILVVPGLNLVIVNRVDTDADGPRMSDEQFGTVVQQILAAKERTAL